MKADGRGARVVFSIRWWWLDPIRQDQRRPESNKFAATLSLAGTHLWTRMRLLVVCCVLRTRGLVVLRASVMEALMCGRRRNCGRAPAGLRLNFGPEPAPAVRRQHHFLNALPPTSLFVFCPSLWWQPNPFPPATNCTIASGRVTSQLHDRTGHLLPHAGGEGVPEKVGVFVPGGDPPGVCRGAAAGPRGGLAKQGELVALGGFHVVCADRVARDLERCSWSPMTVVYWRFVCVRGGNPNFVFVVLFFSVGLLALLPSPWIWMWFHRTRSHGLNAAAAACLLVC